MSPTSFLCEIRVKEPLDSRWSEWFAGMEIIPSAGSNGSLLRGCLPDQAALFGLLGQLRDLNMTVIEVRRLD